MCVSRRNSVFSYSFVKVDVFGGGGGGGCGVWLIKKWKREKEVILKKVLYVF